MMNELTLGGLIAVVGLLVSLSSLASFYFGRKKAASDDARETGGVLTDLKYIKETVEKTTRSLDTLSQKIEDAEHRREDDYRKLLVEFTKLEQSHKSLEHRVQELEDDLKNPNSGHYRG